MYSEYAREFSFLAQSGQLHEEGCCGWILSDLDYREWCGACNQGGNKKNHPDLDELAIEVNEQVAEYEKDEAKENARLATKLDKPQFGVKLGSSGFTRFVFLRFKDAAQCAAKHAKVLKCASEVYRLTTIKDLEEAEFQIDKCEDWESDHF